MKDSKTSSPASPTHREQVLLKHQLHDPDFRAVIENEELRIHSCETLVTDAGPVYDDMYFIGVNVIFCQQGSWLLTADGHEPITLEPDQALVIGAEHFVSFKALDTTRKNILNYTILSGNFAEMYVATLGFYDFMQTPCRYPSATLMQIQRILETKDVSLPEPRTEVLCIFRSLLQSVMEQAKLAGDVFFYDAMGVINRNVIQGNVRIDPVCEELGIGRTQLHRLFAKAGFESPGAYIKKAQYHVAMRLLRLTRLPVSEIARRVGFSSPTQFSAFIRKRSGKSPIQHRNKH